MGMFRITKKETDGTMDMPLDDKKVSSAPEGSEVEVKSENNESQLQDVNGVPIKEVDLTKLVIDGPLSEVYTKALNQVYSKEANVTELRLFKDHLKDDNEESMEEYIYVVDGKTVEEVDVDYIEAFEHISLAKKKFKKVSVCVEHNMNITPNIGRLLSYARESGVTVYSSREKTMAMIRSSVLGI